MEVPSPTVPTPHPAAERRLRYGSGRIAAALELVSGSLTGLAGRRARIRRDRAQHELADAHRLLRQEARLEQELRDVAGAAATAELSGRELATLAAARLHHLLGTTTAAVRRADPEGLTLVGYCGPADPPHRIAWDEYAASTAAVRTRRLARVEDYGPPTGPAAAFAEAQRLTSGIAVPIHLGGRTWGSLTVTTTRRGGFTTEEEGLLGRFAQRLAAPLASAHAQEQLAFRARLEEALREVATASASGDMDQGSLATLAAARVAELLESPGAALVQRKDGRLTILGATGPGALPEGATVNEDSAVGEAISRGEPVLVDNYRTSAKADVEAAHALGAVGAAAVPVRLGGAVWGGFSALLTAPTPPSHAVVLLERFAALMSAALANAHAQERLRFRARFEEALREVASAGAAAEVDERALAGLVAERVADLLGAGAVGVAHFTADGTVLVGTGSGGARAGFDGKYPNSVISTVARTRRTVVVGGHGERGTEDGGLADTRDSGAVAVPVFVSGELWGAIAAVSSADGFLTDAPPLLERFAELVAAALANAHAQARLRDEARLERMMQRITAASASGRLTERSLGQLVADALAELLDVPVSAVVKRDGDWLTTLGKRGRGLPERWQLGVPSVSSRVVATRSVVRADEYAAIGGPIVDQLTSAQPIGSMIGVPVQSHGRVWGCLIAATAPPDRIDAAGERWLVRFARLISATLANTEAQALLRERAAVVTSLHDGLVILDDAGRITSVNEPLCTMIGFTAEELLGQHAPYPFSVGESADELADTEGANAVERVLRRRDGSLARVVASVSTFAGGDGRSAGRAAILKDVSESVVQARLERAMRTIGTASADGHLDERGLADLAAGEVAELLDAPLGAVLRFDGSARLTVLGHTGDFPFPAALLPEDGETVPTIIARTGRPARINDYTAVDGRFARLAAGHGETGAVGVPIRLDGRLWGCIWSLTRRAGGFPPGTESQLERLAALLSVALANVRSVRRLQQEARIEHALREIASASGSGEHDAQALFRLVAARVAEVLEAPFAMVVRVDGATRTIVGHQGAEHLTPQLHLQGNVGMARTLVTGRPLRIDDFDDVLLGRELSSQIGASGCRTGVAMPIRLGGRPWGFIAVGKHEPHSFPADAEALLERFATLVSLALAQAETLAELQRRAMTDDLTGLLNHRAFQERLHVEFGRATRYGRPLSLVMFDLDGFKLINDLHGHEAGNRVLQAVGEALQRHARSGDIAARIGGDEFAVIAPETDSAEAMDLAERLRSLATAAVRALGLPVTMSAGVTDVHDAVTMHDLFHLADSALYYAKHHGRDRIVRDTYDERDQEMSARRSERRRAFSGLTALVRAVDARDPSTQRHSERVAEISVELAIRLGWSAQRCARLREAALLHDVGKIGVPDAILSKSGRLTAEEYEQLKLHPELGARITTGILDDEQVSWIRAHHERPDGRGYPDGMCADAIPDGALLLGIADAYDAMTAGRPYQGAMSSAEALAEMHSLAATQFDSHLLAVLEEWSQSATRISIVPDGPATPEAAVALSG